MKLINQLNEREADLGVRETVSWHSEYKDSAWIFIGRFTMSVTMVQFSSGRTILFDCNSYVLLHLSCLLQADFHMSYLKATSSASSPSRLTAQFTVATTPGAVSEGSLVCFPLSGMVRLSISTWCGTRRQESPKASVFFATKTREAPSWLWTTLMA